MTRLPFAVLDMIDDARERPREHAALARMSSLAAFHGQRVTAIVTRHPWRPCYVARCIGPHGEIMSTYQAPTLDDAIAAAREWCGA